MNIVMRGLCLRKGFCPYDKTMFYHKHVKISNYLYNYKLINLRKRTFFMIYRNEIL